MSVIDEAVIKSNSNKSIDKTTSSILIKILQ